MFGRNPEKLEAKALEYERKGKLAKANKYRQKAAKLRGGQTGTYTTPIAPNTYTTSTNFTQPVPGATGLNAGLNQGLGTTTTTVNTNTWSTQHPVSRYEQNALKWEQRGNWTKAQKNREKIWRMQNPQYAASNYAAPQFYDSQNHFLGYNVPYQGMQQQPMLQKSFATTTQTMAPIVETHVHPTILEQTARPEKIVEVQPIVHREIDAPQIRMIEKHVYETVPSSGPGLITNPTIVQETVKPRIIEEVQPVVHREVPAPFIERVEQHITEHITQPTVTTKQVLSDPVVHGVAAGGVPLQQQGVLPGQQANFQQQAHLQQQANLQQQNAARRL